MIYNAIVLWMALIHDLDSADDAFEMADMLEQYHVESRQVKSCIRNARMRGILEMREQGMTFDEIGEAYGRSKYTIYNQYRDWKKGIHRKAAGGGGAEAKET